MRSHASKCIFFACMTAGSVLMGLYVSNRAFIVTFLCFGWFVYYLIKWLSGERPEKEPTFKETFDKFYGESDDEPDRPSKED